MPAVSKTDNRKTIDTKLIALYTRLSKDDELQGESNSIAMQKKILEDYARKNGFTNIRHFTDDGWSGTRWDRPDFVRLMDEIEADNVSVLLIKDMSRLGRDHLRVGLCLEVLRDKDVRLIAVNEGVDTSKGEDDFMPFRNIIAEWHARDSSRKVKASIRSKGMSGQRLLSHPSYGYMCDPLDKNKWIVDPEASEIVRRIFKMTIEGKGPYDIARILQNEKVYCPSYHLALQNSGSTKHKNFDDPYRWWGASISSIIERMEYIGHTVNFKTYKNSYKDKKRRETPKDELAVFYNTHEAIIDSETWETAQRCRKTVRRIPKKAKEPNRLTGLLFCADCGGKLYHEFREATLTKTAKSNYMCSSYRKHTTECTIHFVASAIIEELILDTLQKVNGFVKDNEDEFIRLLTDTSVKQQEQATKTKRKLLASNQKRIAELDRLIRQIYEDKVNDKLSDKRFEKLSAEYEAEQEQLEQSTHELQGEISSIDEQSTRTDKFLELTRRYTDFAELTTSMLYEFIEKVVVHERVKGGRYSKYQKIDIYFNFIGMVELPSGFIDEYDEANREPELESWMRYVPSDSVFKPLGVYLEKQKEIYLLQVPKSPVPRNDTDATLNAPNSAKAMNTIEATNITSEQHQIHGNRKRHVRHEQGGLGELSNQNKHDNCHQHVIILTFAEIEVILGRPLTKSAYKYPSYWYPSKNRPASNVIFNAGFDVVRVDLVGGRLILGRT